MPWISGAHLKDTSLNLSACVLLSRVEKISSIEGECAPLHLSPSGAGLSRDQGRSPCYAGAFQARPIAGQARSNKAPRSKGLSIVQSKWAYPAMGLWLCALAPNLLAIPDRLGHIAE